MPVSLTAFVGRERELADVQRILESTRLLTLTGAGGSGKTRLASEVAATRPVTWIQLAGVPDPDRVAAHVAEELGIREVQGGAVIDAIAKRLPSERHLLVLDNCEHVIDAVARVAEALLHACPRLQILATSREPLALAGERAWLVPALSLPARDAKSIDPDHFDALRLFVERARDVQPSFVADAQVIAEICRRLDGLPLAIELAAARVRVLTPEQILARLHDSFRLLSSSSRNAIPRHQTLRATMDWSYALLSTDEQRLLDRLSVFGGGFTLDAAEATCSDGALPAVDVLDTLARLVDRSLVAMREHGGSARYALLETVRQYAAAHLRDRGEELAVRRRHADHVAASIVAAEPHLIRTTRREWLARLDSELENIRGALAWSREHAPALHVDMVGRLCWFWFATGSWSEARGWAEGALALDAAAAPTLARARTLFAASVIACMQAQGAVAEPWLGEAIAIARSCGDAQLEAYANNYLGMALVQQQRAGADVPTCAARDWFRAHRDLYGLRLSLLLLGSWHVTAGELEQALALFEEAVGVAREFGLPRELGIALQMLGSTVMQRGDLDRAEALFAESLVALRRDPQFYFLARSLDMLAVLLARRGGTVDAVQLMAAAESARRRIGASAFPIDRRAVEPHRDRLRAALGDAAFEAAWSAGLALELDEAFAFASSRSTAPSVSPPPPPPAPMVIATAPAAALVVRGLGPLEITCGERRLDSDAWSSARARELLLYLLCHPAGKRRDEIGLAFWPDSSAAHVKNSFHVLLHRLRKTLGRGELVILDDDRYRIDPALAPWFDAQVFEQEVRAARRDASRLAAAIALYRGDLFDGVVAGDWHFERQDRLRTLVRDALSTLADLQLDAGDLAAATETLERLVRDDELREDAHRRLVLCYARSGQRDRALQQYERLVDVLRDELAAVPSRATVELVERVRRADAV